MGRYLRKESNKGLSLIELIIVVAIMAVLVGVLAPMFVKYVNRARAARDINTAEEIARATNVAFALYPEAYDTWNSWEKTKEKVSVTVDGKTETYYVYLVVANESNPINCFHGTVKEFGASDGSTGFYGTLNEEIGVSTTKYNPALVPRLKVKKDGQIPGRNKMFGNVDTWRICKRADTGQLEVWSADHNKYGGLPCFRVYPEPDDVYRK